MDNTGHEPDREADLAPRELPEDVAALVGEVTEAPSRSRPRRIAARIGGIAGPEQFLDGHAERVGQGQRHPQRRIGMAGLNRGYGLSGHGGHPSELLLGQATSLPGDPQSCPGGPGSFCHPHTL